MFSVRQSSWGFVCSSVIRASQFEDGYVYARMSKRVESSLANVSGYIFGLSRFESVVGSVVG